jgi:hypothetical protein
VDFVGSSQAMSPEQPVAMPSVAPPVNQKDVDPRRAQLIHTPALSANLDHCAFLDSQGCAAETRPSIVLVGAYDPNLLVFKQPKDAAVLKNAVVQRLCSRTLTEYLPAAFPRAYRNLGKRGAYKNYIAELKSLMNPVLLEQWRHDLKPLSKQHVDDVLSGLEGTDLDMTRTLLQKREKSIGAIGGQLIAANDRVVSAVSKYWSHLSLGPFMQCLSEANTKVVRAHLEAGTLSALPFCIVCGLDPVEIGRVFTDLSKGRKVIRSQDNSEFDGRLTPEILHVEQKFYESLGLSSDEARIISMQICCHIRSDAHVHGVKTFGRNSGDSNTSIGNSIVNSILMTAIYPQSRAMVYSDDSIVFDPELDREQVTAKAALMNQKIKFVDSGRPGATMMSGRFMPCISKGENTHVLTPLVGKCLPKIFWSSSQEAFEHPRQMLEILLGCALRLFKADHDTHRMLTEYSKHVGFIPETELNAISTTTAKKLPWFSQFYSPTTCDFAVDSVESSQYNLERYGPLFCTAMEACLQKQPGPLCQLCIPKGVYEIDNAL